MTIGDLVQLQLVAWLAAVVAGLSLLLVLGVISYLVGKAMSTHKVEFRSIEEHAALRGMLGLEKETPEEAATHRGGKAARAVWAGVDEDYRELENFTAALQAKREREQFGDDDEEHDA